MPRPTMHSSSGQCIGSGLHCSNCLWPMVFFHQTSDNKLSLLIITKHIYFMFWVSWMRRPKTVSWPQEEVSRYCGYLGQPSPSSSRQHSLCCVCGRICVMFTPPTLSDWLYTLHTAQATRYPPYFVLFTAGHGPVSRWPQPCPLSLWLVTCCCQLVAPRPRIVMVTYRDQSSIVSICLPFVTCLKAYLVSMHVEHWQNKWSMSNI